MLSLNLKLFFRNIKRYKTTFFIKVMGLSAALCCVLLIAFWVFDELGVDKFHENDKQLYQLIEFTENEGKSDMNPVSSGLLAETIAHNFPEIKYATSTKPITNTPLTLEEKEVKKDGLFATNDFFKIFSYPIIAGNIDNLLAEKHSIVISESLATMLFGSIDRAIGQSVEFEREAQFIVSGVYKDVPYSSSMQFDFVISYEYAKDIFSSIENWDYNVASTYVLLKSGVNIDSFNSKIKNVINENTSNSNRQLSTRQYSDAYLYGNYENRKQVGGRIQYVQLFSLIAFLILAIACVNYINLTTANANRRLKEIGIKKAVGTSRSALISQYLVESLLTIFFSLIVAIGLVVLMLSGFNKLTGKSLGLSLNIPFVLLIVAILFVTGLVAGSYPALYLSGQHTLTIIKGKLTKTWSEVFARKGLVVFQFIVSIILVIGVLVINQQINYVQQKDLGYSKDNIVYFDIEGSIHENLSSFLSGLNHVEGVVGASSIGTNIIGGNNTFNSLSWPGKNTDSKIVFQMRPINYDMLETLNIDMVIGRGFSKDYGDEASKIIFNEAAIAAMGLKDPIGKTITIQGTELQIIGVAKDFHFNSLHEEIKPLFFVFRPTWTHMVMAKLDGKSTRMALSNVESFYKRYNSNIPFEYTFLDETYQSQYVSERRISKLSAYFAVLAIVISCLGLFGLAIFTAENRKKEIGIRKVLGASVVTLVSMLTKDFITLVGIAFCISAPFAYIVLEDWLQGFAYRISITWWIFAIAGIIAITITLLTVTTQAIQAATSNPVKSLRTE